MNTARQRGGALLLATLLLSGCGFSPNLDRFAECGTDRSCATGFVCLTEANRCVPLCGDEPCPIDPVDAGPGDAGRMDAGTMDASVDAGPDAGLDAGVDAGTDAGLDAGIDAGTDAGTDDGGRLDAGPLTLSSAPLPPAIELKGYGFQFAPSGGVGIYSFRIDGGVPGFTLQTSGLFSAPDGGATQSGFFPFAIMFPGRAPPPTAGPGRRGPAARRHSAP